MADPAVAMPISDTTTPGPGESSASLARDDTLPPDALVHSPVLDLLEEFFCHPSFTSAISDFATENAHTFKPIEGDEHPLHYHELYTKYTAMIEQMIEQFMAEHDVTIDDILLAAQVAPPGVHTCIDYLLASTEYEAFLSLMRDFVSMSQWDVSDDRSLE